VHVNGTMNNACELNSSRMSKEKRKGERTC